MPEKLPMPYHNANPGFPVLLAWISALTGMETARAALYVSAAASALLAASVFALVRFYASERTALVVTAGVILFPLNSVDSLSALPDALSTAFAVAAMACAVRTEKPWSVAAAAALCGLSWLTRSSAMLMMPPLLWLLFRTRLDRWRSLLLFGAVFALVISPWLVHTWRVWGSPLRSDASYYLFQDYYAQRFNGSVQTYWRSVDLPPGIGQILREDAAGLFSLYLRNIPYMAYTCLASLSDWNKPVSLFYIGLAVWAAFATRKLRLWRRPEIQSAFLLFVLTVAVLNIRAYSFEARYLGPALIVLLLWMLAPLASALPARLAAAVLLVYAAVIGLQNIKSFQELTEPSSKTVTLREDVRRLQAEVAGDNPVLLPQPYFYTLFTGRSGLTPPYGTKQQLVRFMDKYSARYMALPTQQLSEYAPDPAALAPELRLAPPNGPWTVFERVQ